MAQGPIASPHRPRRPPLRSDLDLAARARCEARRQRLPIVATTQTPSGQRLGWLHPEAQPGFRNAMPPPGPVRPRTEPYRSAVAFELAHRAVPRGPDGTVPILMPPLPPRGAADAVFKRKRGPVLPPDPAGFYHALSAQAGACFGCASTLNVWSPGVQTSVDHSLSQFAIQNHDLAELQSIEAGWIVCEDINGDYGPHLFVFYTTNGYGEDADDVGGYNTDYDGWVQYDSSIYPGAGFSGSSVDGGSQATVDLRFQLWEANWWLQVEGTWIGYYPADLFMPGQSTFTSLGDHGDYCAFYGEVASNLVDPSQTTTQMGSGAFPAAGWTHAAYQCNTQVQTDRAGTMADSNGTPVAEDPLLYTIDSHPLSGTSWGSYFWFGGPGAG